MYTNKNTQWEQDRPSWFMWDQWEFNIFSLDKNYSSQFFHRESSLRLLYELSIYIFQHSASTVKVHWFSWSSRVSFLKKYLISRVQYVAVVQVLVVVLSTCHFSAQEACLLHSTRPLPELIFRSVSEFNVCHRSENKNATSLKKWHFGCFEDFPRCILNVVIIQLVFNLP
jgi:hypothetical protein